MAGFVTALTRRVCRSSRGRHEPRPTLGDTEVRSLVKPGIGPDATQGRFTATSLTEECSHAHVCEFPECRPALPDVRPESSHHLLLPAAATACCDPSRLARLRA